MDSFFARNRLSAYLDGALSDAEEAELSDAIERDPKLRSEYIAMQKAVELLRREGPTQAPAGFHARVMEKVQDEPGTGGVVVQLRRWWNRVPVEAVALAAAAAVVVMVIQGKPGGDNAEPLADAPAAAAPTDRAAAAAAGDKDEPNRYGDSVDNQQPIAQAIEGEPADGVASADLPEQKGSPAPALGTQDNAGNGAKKTKGVQPFVADWEQGAPASGEMATPMGFKLTVSSPEVLYNLSGIAEQAGGTVRDSAGRELKARMLTTDQDYEQPMLVVPRDQIESVRGHLRAMGGESIAPPSSSSLYPVEYGVFVVEVRYTP